jgi:hypothetical protein
MRKLTTYLHPFLCAPACVCQILNDISAHGVDWHILAILAASVSGARLVKRLTTF